MGRKKQQDQPTLFPMAQDVYGGLLAGNPISHSGDPETSREAAAKHQESGKRDRHAEIVLDMVRKAPGKTAVELWNNAPLAVQIELVEMQEVRRRLVDLEAAGHVRKVGVRTCAVRGSTMVTWEAA